MVSEGSVLMGVEEQAAEFFSTTEEVSWQHSSPSLGLSFLLHKRGRMILPGPTCLPQLMLGDLRVK